MPSKGFSFNQFCNQYFQSVSLLVGIYFPMASSSEDKRNETELATCKSCKFESTYTSMFYCGTCQKGRGLDFGKCLCEVCTVIHLRKKHRVLDSRGFEAETCEKHQNLNLLHCTTCKINFCFNCLSPHSSHDYLLVNDRAVKVRREVFEAIGNFEKNEKKLNACAEVQKEKSRALENMIETSKAKLLQEVAEFEIDLTKRYDEKVCGLKKHLELNNPEPFLSKGSEQEAILRDSLSLSNFQLIPKATDIISGARTTYEEQNSFLAMPPTGVLVDINKALTKSLLNATIDQILEKCVCISFQRACDSETPVKIDEAKVMQLAHEGKDDLVALQVHRKLLLFKLFDSYGSQLYAISLKKESDGLYLGCESAARNQQYGNDLYNLSITSKRKYPNQVTALPTKSL